MPLRNPAMLQAQLRRADKRRNAAEQVAARTRVELLQRNELSSFKRPK